jgi:hypothetical protein
MEKYLFTILKAGLNLSPITTSETEALKPCGAEEWRAMVDLAVKQSVAGVFFDGIQHLYRTYGDVLPKEDWAREIKGRLFGITMQLEQRNRKQVAVMNKVGSFLKRHGCQMMVMKGQACATMYPNPLHRSIGDIDCYLYNDYEKGNELIRQTGVHVDDSWYKHSEFCIEGETFENHQYFVTTRGGKRYKRLDAVLKVLAEDGMEGREGNSLNSEHTDSAHARYDSSEFDSALAHSQISNLNAQRSSLNVQYPPVMFNALFLTYHACIHFVSEGLRLKQVLDWVMFVKVHQEEVDWKALHEMCKEFKLDRFLNVMNAIAVEVFGVEKKATEMVCESPYVEKVMNSILYDDDYIFNTTEGNWQQRFHIVSNMIKYRWKYRDIYQQSIVSQLWTNIVGFIFRTEE